MCKFSIVVPCYNIYNNVEALFHTLSTNDYTDYEAIFVDDCSKDDSYKKMLELAAKYSNYKVYQTPQNGGPGPARNFGLSKASGEYIIFCDSDDEMDMSCLQRFDSFLQAHPDAELIACPHIVARGGKTSVSDSCAKYKSGDEIERKDVAMIYAGPAAKLFKHSVIKENQILFPDRMTGEDACFVLTFSAYAKKVYKMDFAYYKYIMNSASITHNYRDPVDLPTTFEVLLPLYEKYFPEAVVYKFVEGHLMTKAKLMAANKCKNREIKEWFKKENQRYPDWYEHTDDMDRSLYRRMLYLAMYRSDPIMIKFIMFIRSLLY